MDESDSDSDYGGLQRRALPVELPMNFDPSAVPQNGEEYLHHVMYEARRCQKYTHAKIDENKIKTTTYLLPEETPLQKTHASNIPSEEWQQQKLADFSKLRKFVELEKESTNYPFIKGPAVFNTIPTFSETILLHQPQIIMKLSNYLQCKVPCYERQVWLYALLVCLELPLCPDTCHILREIAKIYLKERALLEQNFVDPQLKFYNLIICIIGRYFKQLDLADV